MKTQDITEVKALLSAPKKIVIVPHRNPDGDAIGSTLGFLVTPKSVVCNKLVKKIDFPRSAIIGGIIRDGEGMIALGDFNIIAGDRVVVCCLPQSIKKVEKLFV